MDKRTFDLACSSIVPLANASELAAQVIKNISGNDISNSLNGSPITLATLRSLALARFQNILKL
jgi:hypothetical protein